jgi:hypothetical protein
MNDRFACGLALAKYHANAKPQARESDYFTIMMARHTQGRLSWDS